jgi:hypothetical protein
MFPHNFVGMKQKCIFCKNNFGGLFMKNKQIWAGILVLVFGSILFLGCPTDTSNTSDDSNAIVDTVDSAFWFEEIYLQLIERIGEQFSEEHIGEKEMGGYATCQYVVNVINAKWGTTLQLAAGVADQIANCEYLLKMIDRANNNTTNHGLSARATKQFVDTTAVMQAVNTLWVPGDKFVVTDSGSSKAAYSTDGINWTAATLPSNAYWYSVTYGGN